MQRRRFLGQLAAGATLGTLAAPALAASAPPLVPPRHRVLRVAHLTDTHVFGERGAEAGLTEALRHVQAAQPDFIFFGGDLIMDALGKDKDATLAQWALWDRVIAAELRTPHHSCLGNHDIWGWKLRDAAGLWEGEVGAPGLYQLRVRWQDGSESLIEDPYRFGPVLGDMDVWLLAEGSHLRPYEILGATPRVMDGVAGTAEAA